MLIIKAVSDLFLCSKSQTFRSWKAIFAGVDCQFFWPALSIVSNVTNKYRGELSFEVGDSTAIFHKNTITKLENGAPKEGDMWSWRLRLVGTYPKQFSRDHIFKKYAALLNFWTSLGVKQGDKQGDSKAFKQVNQDIRSNITRLASCDRILWSDFWGRVIEILCPVFSSCCLGGQVNICWVSFKNEEANEDSGYYPIFRCSCLAWNNFIKASG